MGTNQASCNFPYTAYLTQKLSFSSPSLSLSPLHLKLSIIMKCFLIKLYLTTTNTVCLILKSDLWSQENVLLVCSAIFKHIHVPDSMHVDAYLKPG